MNRSLLSLFGALTLALAAPLAAGSGATILLVARDTQDHRVAGVRFIYQEVKTGLTSRAGETELNLPVGEEPGKQIRLALAPGTKGTAQWFLVDPAINVPDLASPAEVVLMRRSEILALAAEVRDARRAPNLRGELSEEDRRKVLIEAAARRGLTETQLEKAIRSFGETQDPRDKGIAAFLEGQYATAEELLERVREKQKSGYLETLRYLGASQVGQGKYRAAASTLRGALSLQQEDSSLLRALGIALLGGDQWAEAESLFRRGRAAPAQGPRHRRREPRARQYQGRHRPQQPRRTVADHPTPGRGRAPGAQGARDPGRIPEQHRPRAPESTGGHGKLPRRPRGPGQDRSGDRGLPPLRHPYASLGAARAEGRGATRRAWSPGAQGARARGNRTSAQQGEARDTGRTSPSKDPVG